ncbi:MULTISPECIES: RecQ family ATP-dependent DNA helicase [unclassified Coleofasciculus]|uniref:RecQ family ATP-dependent DNA helicase n=1 Tax=unclassified Coleofasciculus TaxID=2692782 RepID=UPI00187E427F|nr:MULTISPECIES: ATP-dependent DNA helicase RecQ [unclassified Coleofasciculus]MBE9128153.1 ATP-dependent DNA helicase RecQ [Coleofasciculus sp. LEGE 07081]MBE9151244.1 ATP-dependent DNA helicase RecQ [Coleofasciculus sp. LEGE 07092]
MNRTEPTSWNDVRVAFQKIWGYDNFRPPQGEIVRSLLEKRDALIVLPTGGGKSICFQLPALLQTGLTLVISPLVALMENQVQELRERNLPAALLHSELPAQQRLKTLAALERQQLRLLYLSPETLLSAPVWERLCLPQIEINGLILDEAHCLVQWGDTFRPAYRRLGVVRPSLLKGKPKGTKIAIAAFTATADPSAQQTIRSVLQLQQPKVFLISPYRDNLNLKVQTVWTPRGRRQQMLKFIQAKSEQIGLVYVRSRRDSEELAQWFGQRGYVTAAYHAGLSAEERREIEGRWLSGKTQFVICTCAFGMGINKPDVRWVVHFQSPQLLSEYIQEVGRGGRDGKPSDALTLVSEPTGWLNPEDKQRRQFFADKVRSQYQDTQRLVKKLPVEGEVAAVAKQFQGGAVALALLHSAGQLEWQDPFRYRKHSSIDSRALTQLSAMQQEVQSQMTRYLTTRDCRWQFLLRAFGLTKEAVGFKCAHCDNCLKG